MQKYAHQTDDNNEQCMKASEVKKGNAIEYNNAYQVRDIEKSSAQDRGGNATKRSKPAMLSTDFEIQVPEYIVNGEKITVSTTTSEFGGRA